MMGGWFVSLSVGGFLAGKIGGYWDQTTPSQMFGFFAALLIGAAIPLSFLVPRIKRIIARAEAQAR